jgi:hypothetical protein
MMFAGVLVLILNLPAVASENLNDWDVLIAQGNISLTPNGTSLDVTADGSTGYAWRALSKYFTNNVGLLVTINVADAKGKEPQIGIRKNVGKTPSGNWVLAELYTDSYDSGNRQIRYRVQERDDTSKTLRVLAVGFLGGFGGAWSNGQDLVLGLARVENEIWFYSQESRVLVKVSPLETMSALESEVQIFALAPEGATNSISGTVSDIKILYANDLQDLRQESAKVAGFVTRFYQLCLDRDPDQAGLNDWTNNLLNNILTGADVAHGFIDSKEFLEKNTTNEDYLTILYKAFFNRDPDTAGLNIWLAELVAGKDRGFVLDGFLYSQEFAELCEAYGINPY